MCSYEHLRKHLGPGPFDHTDPNAHILEYRQEVMYTTCDGRVVESVFSGRLLAAPGKRWQVDIELIRSWQARGIFTEVAKRFEPGWRLDVGTKFPAAVVDVVKSDLCSYPPRKRTFPPFLRFSVAQRSRFSME